MEKKLILQAGFIEDENGEMVCIGYEDGDKDYFKDWNKNARRLCAAWNYCEGVPTAELESEGADAGFWGRACARLSNENSILKVENAALRAAVSEMARMLPVLEAVEIRHPGALSEYTPDSTFANVNAYRLALETALAKMEM